MKEIIVLVFLMILICEPLFDGLTSWFLTWIEVKKSALGVKIATAQQEIEKLEANEPQYAIGFTLPEEEEEEEDEDL